MSASDAFARSMRDRGAYWGDAANALGGGVGVGMVEGVEGGAAVDLELERLVGAGVEDRDRDQV
jgi:hypothetical protein